MRRRSDLRRCRRNNLAVMSKCSFPPVDEGKYSMRAPTSHPSTTAFDYEYVLLFLGCCEKLQACPRVLINESRFACKVPALGDTLWFSNHTLVIEPKCWSATEAFFVFPLMPKERLEIIKFFQHCGGAVKGKCTTALSTQRHICTEPHWLTD